MRGMLGRGHELPVVAIVREAEAGALIRRAELRERVVDLFRGRADDARELGPRDGLLGHEENAFDRVRQARSHLMPPAFS